MVSFWVHPKPKGGRSKQSSMPQKQNVMMFCSKDWHEFNILCSKWISPPPSVLLFILLTQLCMLLDPHWSNSESLGSRRRSSCVFGGASSGQSTNYFSSSKSFEMVCVWSLLHSSTLIGSTSSCLAALQCLVHFTITQMNTGSWVSPMVYQGQCCLIWLTKAFLDGSFHWLPDLLTQFRG